MRLAESDTRLTLHDRARGARVLGAVFVASGLAVLSVPWTHADWGGLGAWERLGILAIGLAHLAGGLFTMLQPGASRVELDRASGEGVVYWKGEWPRERALRDPVRVTRFRLADVRRIEVVRSIDRDDDPVFAIRAWLADGRPLPLQAHPVHDERRVQAWAERVRAFAGDQPASSATSSVAAARPARLAPIVDADGP